MDGLLRLPLPPLLVAPPNTLMLLNPPLPPLPGRLPLPGAEPPPPTMSIIMGLEAAEPRRPGEPLPREEDEGAEGGLAIDAGKGK